ncbi:MAG TPA: GNAT family N-acetyltransferase [Thermoanaerobaculia bacterium]|nr:GNAT family N-acetyltransferase [Thermoanaerobaculia bacterium]
MSGPNLGSLRLRPARPEDLPFLIDLAARLGGFPLPPWRRPHQIGDAEHEGLTAALAQGDDERLLAIAESEAGEPFGYVWVEPREDFFTKAPYGHVSVLAVAERAEGRGVGRALMAEAERWTRERGMSHLGLNVWTQNLRARRLYEDLGYGEETLHYVKWLA